MRRAGFGAARDELEARAAKGYEATVEELLNPESQPPVDPYELLRYQPAALLPGGQPPLAGVLGGVLCRDRAAVERAAETLQQCLEVAAGIGV